MLSVKHTHCRFLFYRIMQILNFSAKEKSLKSYRGEQQCRKIISGINLDLNKVIQERMENENDPIVTEHIEIFLRSKKQ